MTDYSVYYTVLRNYSHRILLCYITLYHPYSTLLGSYAFNLKGGDVKGERRPQQQDLVGESLRFPVKTWCFFSVAV